MSDQSDPFQIPKLLSLHGVAPPPFVRAEDMADPVVDRCEQFFNESTAQVQRSGARGYGGGAFQNYPTSVTVTQNGVGDSGAAKGQPIDLTTGKTANLPSRPPLAALHHGIWPTEHPPRRGPDPDCRCLHKPERRNLKSIAGNGPCGASRMEHQAGS